jgi:hypothetical protein
MINKLYDFQTIHKAGTSAINYGKVQNNDDGYFVNDTSIKKFKKKFKWKKSLNVKMEPRPFHHQTLLEGNVVMQHFIFSKPGRF